jgi:hypothetical protein
VVQGLTAPVLQRFYREGGRAQRLRLDDGDWIASLYGSAHRAKERGPRAAPGPEEVQPGSFSVEDRATLEYADSASQAKERSRASVGGSSGSQTG